MEVVVAASVITQVGLHLCDSFVEWRVRNTVTAGPVHESSTDRGHQETEDQEAEQLPTKENDSRESGTVPEEGSIQALELKLEQLRERAKELTSPDSFVQYARVNREANKVEKEIKQKKGKLLFSFRGWRTGGALMADVISNFRFRFFPMSS